MLVISLLFSEFLDEHIDHVCNDLTLLNDVDVSLLFKKCTFFTKTFDYINYVIQPRHPEFASHSMNAIRGLQRPTNLTERRSFFGMCKIFRCFIANFARLPALLNKNIMHATHRLSEHSTSTKCIHWACKSVHLSFLPPTHSQMQLETWLQIPTFVMLKNDTFFLKITRMYHGNTPKLFKISDRQRMQVHTTQRDFLQ